MTSENVSSTWLASENDRVWRRRDWGAGGGSGAIHRSIGITPYPGDPPATAIATAIPYAATATQSDDGQNDVQQIHGPFCLK